MLHICGEQRKRGPQARQVLSYASPPRRGGARARHGRRAPRALGENRRRQPPKPRRAALPSPPLPPPLPVPVSVSATATAAATVWPVRAVAAVPVPQLGEGGALELLGGREGGVPCRGGGEVVVRVRVDGGSVQRGHGICVVVAAGVVGPGQGGAATQRGRDNVPGGYNNPTQQGEGRGQAAEAAADRASEDTALRRPVSAGGPGGPGGGGGGGGGGGEEGEGGGGGGGGGGYATGYLHAQLHVHVPYKPHLFPVPPQHTHVHHPQNAYHHSHNPFASLLAAGAASTGGSAAGGAGQSAGAGAGVLEMAWPVHGDGGGPGVQPGSAGGGSGGGGGGGSGGGPGQDWSPYNASLRRRRVVAGLSLWHPAGCVWWRRGWSGWRRQEQWAE
ncbi:hypothetical protein BU17DRAFT_86724 [Hysterangium stoloniferum]|nr:hypothetical protein BU17DRAFT_86724 [Hysterangium stoloniferum]